MAHFAQIDDNNIVTRVIVIADEYEHDGQSFINQELGLDGTWLQCSYNGAIRENFPSIGFIYIPDEDIFVEPAPKPWFVLNEHCDWVCPVGLHPETGQPLTEKQWEFLEVVYAIKPQFPTGFGPWTPRNEKQYEEGLQRANLSN